MPWNVPLNAAATASFVLDTSPVSVDPVNRCTTPDPWNPLGHASVVAHVVAAVDEYTVVPFAVSGVPDCSNSRLPGCEPTPASAVPAVPSAAPAVKPAAARITAPRRSRPAVIHFRFSFIAGFFPFLSAGARNALPRWVVPGMGR